MLTGMGCGDEQRTVWVVETGEWADRMIWGVASSVEAAAHLVRSSYPPPYIVRWEEPKQDEDGEWSMTGHFDAVPGYAAEGAGSYDFTPYQVDASR
jgi:hypothetical protein